MDPERRVATTVARYSDRSETVFRMGLGLVMAGAGIHGMLAPAVWAGYMAPQIAGILSAVGLSPVQVMQVNAVGEALFGLALLADMYTTVVAGLTTLALAAILVNMILAGVGSFADIIIRDIGLLFLGAGVTLQAARRRGVSNG
ncbi:MAG: DoxX family protein [Candidatus Nanohaloarchaea archaeon]|nr:DoxX family protein [Candidatus Nanohaloarchaea archaeon]